MKYSNLFLMSILSFLSMFILMYIMVDSYSNIYLNLNQFYMAGLMTLPMIVFELIFMQSMYNNKKANIIILISSVLTFVLLLIFIRKQKLIDDKEFLKSMIPHHASALLMCKEAKLTDPEIKNLCKNISSGQQSEIDFMKSKLKKTK